MSARDIPGSPLCIKPCFNYCEFSVILKKKLIAINCVVSITLYRRTNRND